MKIPFSKTLLAVLLWLPCVAAAETAAERLTRATFKVFNPESTSTGFLVQDPSAAAPRTNVVLVTAAHTFKKAKGDHVLLVCRVKSDKGGWERYDHKILIRQGAQALWTSHPTQDVAVIRCVLPPQAIFDALPQSSVADEAVAKDKGLTVGSHLIFSCYPNRTEANAAGFPLLREGIASGYPLFPAAAYPTFLFSAATFAGDSGAPVALSDTSGKRVCIIGLIVSRTQDNERLKSSEGEISFKRDMDLGAILHAVYIREALALLK